MTTQPDDELAQQAPVVPDIGRADGTRTDGGRTPTDETRTTPRVPRDDTTTQRTYDDELAQEAPLVPDLGRPTTDDTTTR